LRLIHKFWLSLGILPLIAASGCGTGGSIVLPNPTGNYSVADLNGSYVYQIHGTSQLGPYREIGAFTTDRAGHITGGSDDFVTGGVVSNHITGTYSVANDGTGFLSIGPTALGQITFAITLVSSSKLYLMEADNFADGAGVAELQDSTAINTAPSGAFVYRLHQLALLGQNPVSEVGAITISAGAVTGNLDQNLGGTSSQLTLTGSFGAPVTLGRGTGSFTDNTNFTTNFIYYIENSGKLVLLVSNSGTIESGSAEAQTGAVGNGLSGSYAFGSRGDIGALYDAVATVGQFSATGGTINSYGNDSMLLGSYSNASFTGSYTTQSNGRVAVALNSGAIQEVFWMVSPSRAFFLVNDPSKVEDGTADIQIGLASPASTLKGQYAMVMDGIDLSPEILARIGTAQFSSNLVISELANASGSGVGAQSPGSLGGNYTVAANGRTVGNLTNSSGFPLTLVLYPVSPSDAYTLQVDSGTNTSGTISLQH
jgi:hypothetical protein